jgi:hypothetical protein
MKAWQTQDWKNKREEILKNHDGKCQICDSQKGPFNIHHNWDKEAVFKKIAHGLAKEKGIKGIFPSSSRPEWARFLQSHPEIREQAKEAKNRLYLSLDKDTLIICKKCHFLIHKGYSLCQDCLSENKITWTTYDYCYQHHMEHKKEEEEMEKLAEVDIEVKVPCGLIVTMSKLDYEVMGTFEYCHECDKFYANGGCIFLAEEH